MKACLSIYEYHSNRALQDFTQNNPLTPFKKNCLICIQIIQAVGSILSIALCLGATVFVDYAILGKTPEYTLLKRVFAATMCTAMLATMALASTHFLLTSMGNIKALFKEVTDEASTPLLNQNSVANA